MILSPFLTMPESCTVVYGDEPIAGQGAFPGKNPLFRRHYRQNDPFCRYSKVPSPVLVRSLNLGPIWQASDSLSPRAPGSARRPFFKFAPEPASQPSGRRFGVRKFSPSMRQSALRLRSNQGRKIRYEYRETVRPGIEGLRFLSLVLLQPASGIIRRRCQVHCEFNEPTSGAN